MKTGDHISVHFTSESSTEFSGKTFSGNGIIDRIEDGRVFGRLYTGLPFMCNPADVTVNVSLDNMGEYFDLLLRLKLLSSEEVRLIQSKNSDDLDLLNMSEFGLHIFAHFQSVIHEMAQKVADLEFQLLQQKEAV